MDVKKIVFKKSLLLNWGFCYCNQITIFKFNNIESNKNIKTTEGEQSER